MRALDPQISPILGTVFTFAGVMASARYVYLAARLKARQDTDEDKPSEIATSEASAVSGRIWADIVARLEAEVLESNKRRDAAEALCEGMRVQRNACLEAEAEAQREKHALQERVERMENALLRER